jgi:hypothetical protein
LFLKRAYFLSSRQTRFATVTPNLNNERRDAM